MAFSKKQALSKILNGNKELIKIWNELRKQAVKDDSAIPDEIAWIKFREIYMEDDEGFWIKK